MNRESLPCLRRVATLMATLIVFGVHARAQAQTPLGTAITYQGRLKSGGNPANGSHDLQFTLYGVPAGGSIVAGPNCADNVDVADGLFTVALDFGAVFDGHERWLEIGVRADSTAGNCGTGAYTPLTPRQLLTATPYAARALSAPNGHALDAADGSPTDALFVDNAGNVGIGTGTPAELLHLRSAGGSAKIAIDGGIADQSAIRFLQGGADRFVVYRPGGSPDLRVYSNSLTNDVFTIQTSTGNVGIGTSNPAGKVDVVGGVSGLGEELLNAKNSSGAYLGAVIADANGDGQLLLFDWIGGAVSSQTTRISAKGDSFFAGSNSNVGIGTTAPGAKLHIVQAEPTRALRLDGTSSNYARMEFVSGHPTTAGIINRPTTKDFFFGEPFDTGKWVFRGSGAMTVEGNVGIGTTTPAQQLHVTANARVDGTLFASTVSSNSPLQLQTAGSTRIFVNDTTGNVGIGTTTPAARVHAIYGSPNTDLSTPVMVLDNPPGGNATSMSLRVGNSEMARIRANSVGDLVLSSGSSPAGNVYFGTPDLTYRMFINGASGNVGIGTTSPEELLHVRSSGGSAKIAIDGGIADQSAIRFLEGGADRFVVYRPGGSPDLRVYSNSLTGDVFTIQTSTGNVGIGTTSPGQKLHVVGNICATGTIGACSDARFKKNVAPVENALGLLEKLRPVRFDWKREEFPDHAFTGGRQAGLLAQEVRKVAPEVVQEGSDGYLSIDYGRLTPILVQAVKEQQDQLQRQRSQIEQLMAHNAALESRMAALEQALNEPKTAQDR